MAETTARVTTPLGDTQYDIDVREAPRYGCPDWRIIRILVRPSLEPRPAAVKDISAKGIGLVCEAPAEVGSPIAVLWPFGPPRLWRTVRATVVRVSPRRRGGWVIGCTFDEWLRPAELEAFFIQGHGPAHLDDD